MPIYIILYKSERKQMYKIVATYSECSLNYNIIIRSRKINDHPPENAYMKILHYALKSSEIYIYAHKKCRV